MCYPTRVKGDKGAIVCVYIEQQMQLDYSLSKSFVALHDSSSSLPNCWHIILRQITHLCTGTKELKEMLDLSTFCVLSLCDWLLFPTQNIAAPHRQASEVSIERRG
jgi:hypothetical protein